MIAVTNDIPESMQYVAAIPHTFYDLSMDGERYAVAALRFRRTECHVHLRFCRFGHRILRHFEQYDQHNLKAEAKAHGCRTAVCIFENHSDEKMLKFIRRFGFSSPKLLAVSKMEI